MWLHAQSCLPTHGDVDELQNSAIPSSRGRLLFIHPVVIGCFGELSLGMIGLVDFDEFSEKLQAASEPPLPPSFRKTMFDIVHQACLVFWPLN